MPSSNIPSTKNYDASTSNRISHSIKEEKQALRQEMRAKLKALTSDEIQSQSDLVWERLLELPAYQRAKSVGLFLSMPLGEIQTATALHHAVQDKKDIYVPHVGKNFEQADMELVHVPSELITNFAETWPRNKWGIPEPPADRLPLLKRAQPGDLDLVVVPGLAFDRHGRRLGQGKGYYDRFLKRMSIKEPHPFLVAVGLQCQLLVGSGGVDYHHHSGGGGAGGNHHEDHNDAVDGDSSNDRVRKIPVDEHDFIMDMILLPEEGIVVQKK